MQIFRVCSLRVRYWDGEDLNLLTRKITATSATAISIKPGAPTSSAKPVLGSAVEVGMTVWVVFATWVRPAAIVTVAGAGVGEEVAVASAITGVLVGGTVGVTAAV